MARRMAAVAALVMVAACGSRDERAAKFAGQYEAALAADDLWTARTAMQQAVQHDDSNAEYWAALGGVQLKLADYSGAYGSYLRANELDRSNATVLQTLADLSVMSGHVEESRRYAKQVLLLQPSDPAPQTTLGFVALRDRDYDSALKRADTVLAVRPSDSNATILRARALASTERDKDAVALLEAYTAAHPDDAAALDALGTISGRFGNLKGQKAALTRQMALNPRDPALRFAYARTLYALGEREEAHALTTEMVNTGTTGGRLIDILGLWMRYEPRADSVAQVRALAEKASPSDLMRYAYFLMLAGVPAETEALVVPLVALPVTSANASPLALLAQARGMQGRREEALALLDKVLAFDDGNIMALRARADLYVQAGRGRDALADAQRLVASKPRSPDDRVRMARAYLLAGQPQMAENAYRGGMEDVIANPLLFADLRKYLVAAGRTQDVAALDQQYADQKRLARVQW